MGGGWGATAQGTAFARPSFISISLGPKNHSPAASASAVVGTTTPAMTAVFSAAVSPSPAGSAAACSSGDCEGEADADSEGLAVALLVAVLDAEAVAMGEVVTEPVGVQVVVELLLTEGDSEVLPLGLGLTAVVVTLGDSEAVLLLEDEAEPDALCEADGVADTLGLEEDEGDRVHDGLADAEMLAVTETEGEALPLDDTEGETLALGV